MPKPTIPRKMAVGFGLTLIIGAATVLIMTLQVECIKEWVVMTSISCYVGGWILVVYGNPYW